MLLVPFFSFGYSQMQPYLPSVFEFQFFLGYTQQRYSHIDKFPLKAVDHYLDSTLSLSLTPVIELGLEASLLNTTARKPFMDLLGGYMRYLVLDDLTGDVFSLTVNLELLAPFKKALTTFGRFYQGRFETILSASIGKECGENPLFLSKFWGLAGIGVSDKKSSFSPFEFWLEFNYKSWFQFAVFGKGNVGWGSRKFVPSSFCGYQKMQYRAIDLGLKTTFTFGIWGDLTVEYARRVYSKLVPSKMNRFTAIYHFPFSIF